MLHLFPAKEILIRGDIYIICPLNKASKGNRLVILNCNCFPEPMQEIKFQKIDSLSWAVFAYADYLGPCVVSKQLEFSIRKTSISFTPLL